MSVLLHGGTVWAGTRCRPAAGWVLVGGHDVTACGTGAPPSTVLEAADETVDLGGAHLLPGFVDVHSHLSTAAWRPAVGDGSRWTSLREALTAVAAQARSEPAAPWLLFLGAQPNGWPEHRLPTAVELDEATGGRRVTIACVDLHRGAVSSEVLGKITTRGVHWLAPAHPGDVRRGRGGRPTGEVFEAALSEAVTGALRALADRLGEAGVDTLLRVEALRHLRFGITHAHDPGVDPAAHGSLVRLASRSALGLSWAAGPRGGLLHPTPSARELPPGPYGLGAPEVKVFTDGADRCAVCLPPRAALGLVVGTLRAAASARSLAPLRDEAQRGVSLRDRHLHTSALRYRDDELARLLADHAAAGHRVRVHALGNLAVEQATRVLAEVGVPPRDATLEHVTFLDRRQTDLLAASGAWVSYQPGFLSAYEQTITSTGVHRHLRVLAGRTMLAAGCRLVLSSDQPCGPLDPLHNLRAAVTRTTDRGTVLQAEEALDLQQAVRASTTTAAASLGLPTVAGIEPGAPADLAVLTGHPLEASTSVCATYVRGSLVDA